ncbi:MAG: peptidoglycan-binding protein [Oscillospiraceae bacterium]|nr:peptidoglycan-binding protein [Oscillospiraceae bacterium]
MTESQLRTQIVDRAKSWAGRKEADGSHREIIDVYNSIDPLPRGYRMTYSDPWCAAFVSACAQVLGLTKTVFPECGCIPMINLYKQHGRWMEDDAYRPQPGDVIFYDWEDSGVGDNVGASDHVGLVTGVDGGVISIIEGNCGNAVRYTARKINSRYIRGYGLPDYASMADGIEEPPGVVIIPDEDTSSDADASPSPGGEGCCMVELPVLMVGDVGEAVRAAQILLEKRGFKCGWMGCDGEFGDKTQSAVGKFQRSRGLETDGVIGPLTWAALIKLT